jgi:hypothetical protein
MTARRGKERGMRRRILPRYHSSHLLLREGDLVVVIVDNDEYTVSERVAVDACDGVLDDLAWLWVALYLRADETFVAAHVIRDHGCPRRESALDILLLREGCRIERTKAVLFRQQQLQLRGSYKADV